MSTALSSPDAAAATEPPSPSTTATPPPPADASTPLLASARGGTVACVLFLVTGTATFAALFVGFPL